MKCQDVSSDNEFVLPPYFIDGNWIPYVDALLGDNTNELSSYIGKTIIRIRPTKIGNDMSFMYDKCILVSASQHHMVIINKGTRYLLNSLYTDPKDWKLVE